MRQRKSLYWFIFLAFGLAWVLFLLPLFFNHLDTASLQTVRLVAWSVAMWAPGLAAILVNQLVDRRSFSELNLTRLGSKSVYVWAWFLPFVLTLLTGVFTWLTGLGKLDTEFTALRQAMQPASGGAEVQAQSVVMIQIAAAILLGPLFNMLFALGEELGWRGYLLPKLLPLGQWRAILVSGIIWGLWHAPAILQGHNYPDHPILGVFLMVGFCVLLGAILSWLYLRTLSPWAPALGHGAVNAYAGLPLLFLTDVDLAFGGTLASLAGWVPLALFVGWLAWTRRLPAPALELEEKS